MLPGRDGFELLAVVRRSSTAAALMLTARDELADRLHGLSRGADDYLVKPFAMAELVARIHAILRAVPAGRQLDLGRRPGDQRRRRRGPARRAGPWT